MVILSPLILWAILKSRFLEHDHEHDGPHDIPTVIEGFESDIDSTELSAPRDVCHLLLNLS